MTAPRIQAWVSCAYIGNIFQGLCWIITLTPFLFCILYSYLNPEVVVQPSTGLNKDFIDSIIKELEQKSQGIFSYKGNQ